MKIQRRFFLTLGWNTIVLCVVRIRWKATKFQVKSESDIGHSVWCNISIIVLYRCQSIYAIVIDTCNAVVSMCFLGGSFGANQLITKEKQCTSNSIVWQHRKPFDKRLSNTHIVRATYAFQVKQFHLFIFVSVDFSLCPLKCTHTYDISMLLTVIDCDVV